VEDPIMFDKQRDKARSKREPKPAPRPEEEDSETANLTDEELRKISGGLADPITVNSTGGRVGN
jgi:hypothetical protein